MPPNPPPPLRPLAAPPPSSSAVWIIAIVVGGGLLVGAMCLGILAVIGFRFMHHDGASPAVTGGATAGWQTFTSTAGRYSVSLPGRPKTRTESKSTPAGAVVANIAYVETPSGDAFLVVYSDLPAVARSDPKTVFDDGCRAALAGTQGKSQSSGDMTVAGCPGRELKFRGTRRGQAFQCHVRLALAGNRLYQVMWVGGDEKPVDDVERFLSSFQLTSPPSSTKSPQPTPKLPPRAQPPQTPPRRSSPAEKPPPKPRAEKPGLEDVSVRQEVYRAATLLRPHFALLEKQRNELQAKGLDVTGIDRQLGRLCEQQEKQYDSVCRRYAISRERLDEVLHEGDAAGWRR